MKLPYGFDLLSRYFRVFRTYAGNRIYLIIALSLAMSYAEGIGIALFFPLFNQGQRPASDALSTTLASVFRFFHIPLTPLGALPFILLLFLIKALLQLATLTVQLFSSTLIVRRLRAMLIERFRDVDYQRMFSANTGQFTTLIIHEVGRAAAGLLYYARSLAPAINVVVFIGMALLLDWRLTLACLGVGLLMILILRLTGRLARRYSEVMVVENSILTHLLIQTFQAFKYLRTTARFGRFEKKINRACDELAHADYRTGAAFALMQSVPQPVMLLFVVAVMYYRVAVRGEMLASLFVVLIYFFRISSELFALQTHWQTFCAYLGSIDVVEKALADLGQHREPRGTRPFTGWNRVLTFEHVDFAYGPERKALQDIQVEIPKCSTVAFVGESGSGKTTLIDLLAGTLRPTSGRIVIDGEYDLSSLDIEGLRRRIGYVPQDAIVFDDTVANNITLWGDAEPEGIRIAAERAKCLEFIEAMPQGFDSPIGDRGVKLSGGQRQRLAIARELFKQPEILILDEATSSLDSESERAIQQSIDALKGQMTILVVAHRLSTIRSCDRVYVLHEGRIVEEGGYDELLTRPGSRFQRMCTLQSVTENVG